MKRYQKLFFALIPVVLLSACATGPAYKDVRATLPALSPDQGRIWFYRDSALGAALQPDVNLNGQKVGTAKPGGFFFVDRTPGNYEAVTGTEVEKKLTFTLDKGQHRHVRLAVGWGVLLWRVYPELADPKAAEEAMQDLAYMSPASTKP
jgi:hypothetical protein